MAVAAVGYGEPPVHLLAVARGRVKWAFGLGHFGCS